MTSRDCELFFCPENEPFPNNPRLPLILYRGLDSPREAQGIEKLFSGNRWKPAWRYGLFPYHHYHSTAHQALGCYSGEGRIQFGGPGRRIIDIVPGIVALIPAGVAHCNVKSTRSFSCVGAYPPGRQWDLLRDLPGELETARQNIPQVPLPEMDPVLGEGGTGGSRRSDSR